MDDQSRKTEFGLMVYDHCAVLVGILNVAFTLAAALWQDLSLTEQITN